MMTFDASLLGSWHVLDVLLLRRLPVLGRGAVTHWLAVLLHVRARLVDLAVKRAFVRNVVIGLTHRSLKRIEVL